MADFVYTPNSANLEKFFTTIQGIGKPDKVTFKWLTSIGFKSSNDRYITSILKVLGFTDSAGTPSERWQTYRNKAQARAIMAQALREGYTSLFATYPDAYRKDDEALRNFFSTHTKVGEKALSYMVRTFKSLAELADFEFIAEQGVLVDSVGLSSMPVISGSIKQRLDTPTTKGVTINVNIQLQLPATEDATIYDKLFEALKRHILS